MTGALPPSSKALRASRAPARASLRPVPPVGRRGLPWGAQTLGESYGFQKASPSSCGRGNPGKGRQGGWLTERASA